jgi:hypothetical protein
MIAQVVEELADGKQDVLDSQVSTALLAGIVAETESFGNSKTSPTTMEVAGRLLAAGANQELVATKLTGPLKHELPAARAAAESHPHGRKHKETAAEKDEASTAHASHKQTADYDTPATPEVDTTDGELITGTATAAATHADPELPDGSVDIIDQPTAASDISNGASSEESEMVTTPVIDNSIDASDLADVASSVAEEISATDASETVVTEPAPQVYDLSESNAPASVPDAPDVVPTGSDQSLLQPLRDQNGLVSQPPLYDKAATAAQEGTTESVDSTLDPTKFALTPPSLGGRLSGTDDAEEPTPPANPLAEAEAAVVTHHSMMTHGAPGVPGSAAVDASTTATATAPDAAPVAAAVMHHEKKLVVPGSEPAPATPVLADASNPLAGLEVIDPNASPASAPAFASVAPVAPVAPAPTMMPASFGTSDENELAALGIIQPGSTNMAAPLPGLAPGSQPIGSAPPLTAPPQPVGSFGMPR